MRSVLFELLASDPKAFFTCSFLPCQVLLYFPTWSYACWCRKCKGKGYAARWAQGAGGRPAAPVRKAF